MMGKNGETPKAMSRGQNYKIKRNKGHFLTCLMVLQRFPQVYKKLVQGLPLLPHNFSHITQCDKQKQFHQLDNRQTSTKEDDYFRWNKNL